MLCGCCHIPFIWAPIPRLIDTVLTKTNYMNDQLCLADEDVSYDILAYAGLQRVENW